MVCNKKTVLLFVCLGFSLSVQAIQQEKIGEYVRPWKEIRYLERDYSWIDNGWKNQDKSERDFVLAIDKLFQVQKDKIAIRNTYAKKLDINSHDKVGILGWTYCLYKICMESNPPIDRNNILQDCANAEALLRDKNLKYSYDVYRIRFLIESTRVTFGGGKLILAGKLLLKQNPADDDVKYAYAKMLASVGDNKADIDQSIVIINEFIKNKPNSDTYYSLLGFAYRAKMVSTKNPEYGEKAITAMQSAIKFTRNLERQNRRQNYMLDIQKYMKKITVRTVF
jgi:hypothetical protein